VAAVPSAVSGAYVTLDAGARTLRDVRALSAPSGAAPYLFREGLFGFEVPVAPGGSAEVQLTLSTGARPTGYSKYDPATGRISDFSFDGTTGAVISGNVITLHLVDGGRGDADGVVNGVIADPGGPTGLPPLVQTF